MLLLAAGFLVSLASGFLLVSLFWPSRRPSLRDLPLQLSLSAGLGLGLSGCVAFAVAALAGPSRAAIITGDLVALALLAALVGARQMSKKPQPTQDLPPSTPAAPWVKWLMVGFILLLALGVWSFATGVMVIPDGAWDTWTFWNLRAKYLVQNDPAQWKLAFEPVKGMIGFHPEYPPLFPMMLARLWQWQGDVSRHASILLAATFTFATLSLLVSALWRISTPGKGLVAGAVLLGLPLFIRHGTWQYADLPIAWFFLAALALLTLHDAIGGKGFGLCALAGAACAMAALTKNEGILFLAVAALAWGALTWWRGDRATRDASLGAFLAAAAPAAALLVYFETCVAPDVPLLAPEGAVAPWAVHFDRAGAVLRFFWTSVTAFEYWGPLPWVLPFYLLLAGARVEKRERRSVTVCLAVVALMLAGYFGVYLVTRDELTWLLMTTMARVLVQACPIVLFTFFMVASPPERVELEPGKAAK